MMRYQRTALAILITTACAGGCVCSGAGRFKYRTRATRTPFMLYILVGQRHFLTCNDGKSSLLNSIADQVDDGGMQDLMRSASMPKARNLALRVLACDRRAWALRRW